MTMQTYNLHRTMYPYGKFCDGFQGMLVVASLCLWYSKHRKMRHTPDAVHAWIRARLDKRP